MEALNIPATRNTPAVRYRPEKASLRIVGNSIPENASGFFGPVVNWLQAHMAELPDTCEFAFNLPYFNSSSLKGLYMVLAEVKKGMDQGKNFTVAWHVEEADDFMTEAGETFRDMLGMPFTFPTGHCEA